jgi:hypothetical protein
MFDTELLTRLVEKTSRKLTVNNHGVTVFYRLVLRCEYADSPCTWPRTSEAVTSRHMQFR